MQEDTESHNSNVKSVSRYVHNLYLPFLYDERKEARVFIEITRHVERGNNTKQCEVLLSPV